MKATIHYFVLLLIILIALNFTTAQNPIIRNQFTADPSARVFNGKVYVFPSHDILTPQLKPGRKEKIGKQ
jgi:hypothetical protein